MSDFRFPGVFWSALMTALPLLSVWLTEHFGAYGWAPSIAGLLLILARVLSSVSSETELPPGVHAAARGQSSIWW